MDKFFKMLALAAIFAVSFSLFSCRNEVDSGQWQPTSPVKPDKTDEPDKPDEPDTPDEPSKPDEPEQPEEPSIEIPDAVSSEIAKMFDSKSEQDNFLNGTMAYIGDLDKDKFVVGLARTGENEVTASPTIAQDATLADSGTMKVSLFDAEGNEIASKTHEVAVGGSSNGFKIEGADFQEGKTVVDVAKFLVTVERKFAEGEEVCVVSFYGGEFALNSKGDKVVNIAVEKGGKVSPVSLSNEKVRGHRFASWFKDAACTQAFDFESPVEKSITLYSKWNAINATLRLYRYGADTNYKPNRIMYTVGDKAYFDAECVKPVTNIDDGYEGNEKLTGSYSGFGGFWINDDWQKKLVKPNGDIDSNLLGEIEGEATLVAPVFVTSKTFPWGKELSNGDSATTQVYGINTKGTSMRANLVFLDKECEILLYNADVGPTENKITLPVPQDGSTLKSLDWWINPAGTKVPVGTFIDENGYVVRDIDYQSYPSGYDVVWE